MYRVCIVGGGFYGLTLAYCLRRIAPNVAITVVERSSKTGGSLSTVKAKSRKHPKRSYLFECGDPFLRSSSLAVCHMLERLDLEKNIVQWSTSPDKPLGCGFSYFYPPRYFVPSPTQGVASSWFSYFLGRIRFMAEAHWMPRSSDKEDLTVWEFVERRYRNPSITERYHYKTQVEHMGDSRKLSMRSCYPDDWKKEQLYGSLARGDIRQDYALTIEDDTTLVRRINGLPFLTLRGGMQTLAGTIEKKITSAVTHDELIERNLEFHGFQRDEVRGLDKDSWKLSVEQRANLLPIGGDIGPTKVADSMVDMEPSTMKTWADDFRGPPVEILTDAEVLSLDFSVGQQNDSDEVGVVISQREESASKADNKKSKDALEKRVEVNRTFDHVVSTTSSFDIARILEASFANDSASDIVSDLRSVTHNTSYRVNFAWPYEALDTTWLGYRPPFSDVPYVKPLENASAEHQRQMFQATFPPPVSINLEDGSKISAVIHDSGMFPQLNAVKPDETRISVLIRDREREPSENTDSESFEERAKPTRSSQEVMDIAGKYVREILGIKALPDAAHLHTATNDHPQYLPGHQKLVDRIEEATSKLSPSLTICSKSLHGVGFSSGLLMAEAMAAELNEAVVHATADPGDFATEGGIPLRWIHAVDADLGYNPSNAKADEIVFDGSMRSHADADNLRGPIFTGVPDGK